MTMIDPAILAQAIQRELSASENDVLTQDMVAVRFAQEQAGRLRYDHDTGRWYEWVGTHWAPDRTEQAFQGMRVLARQMADDIGSAALRQAGAAKFVQGVEQLARGDSRIACTSEAWDSQPWLLGTPNGTVDLRTGAVLPPSPDHGITKLTAVGPALEPEIPTWERFLREVTEGNADYERFIRQWAGYCLTGITREHALAFAYGQGGRGKSVFIETLSGLLADYAVTAPMTTFTETGTQEHPTELARLRGARLVTASETEQGRAWAEARIKALTGGDKIAARFMRGDYFEFRPNFKLTIIGNHRPVLRNVGDAERRRFNFMPFNYKPEVPDPGLGERLRAEWPGILTWAINGCLDWQENGLVRPPIVQDATADYFAGQDILGAWIEADLLVEPGNDFRFESVSALYSSWKAYAAGAGEREGSLKALSEKLQARGFSHVRTGRARGFRGVSIKPNPAVRPMTDDGL